MGENLKLHKKYFQLTFTVSLVILSLSCQEFDRDNPYDPGSSVKANDPSNFTATVLSDTEIKLQWKHDGNAIGFNIQKKNGINGQYVQIAEVHKDSTSYIDTKLKTGIHYFYRVKAFNASHESQYMETDVNHIFPAPSNLIATQLSDTQIKLNWSDNSNFENGFKIERKIDSTGTYSEIGVVTVNNVTFTDDNIQLGINYWYQVRVFTTNNQSDYSNQKNLTPVFPAPLNLNAIQLTETKVKLIWQDNCNFETGFKIERKQVASGVYSEIDSVGSNETTYEDNTVQLWETYYYRIKAVTSKDTSGYSNEISITLDFPAPSNLTVTSISETQIRINWQDNCNFEEGYKVRYVREGYADTIFNDLLSNSTTYFIDLLDRNETYFVAISAFTLWDESTRLTGKFEYNILHLYKTLSGHADDIESVAFSPDGKWLASGGLDDTVKIWEFNWNWLLVP